MNQTVQGLIGGRRAEFRFEGELVRVQRFTLVTQQPDLDLALPVAEIKIVQVTRGMRWSYILVSLLFSLAGWSQLRKTHGTIDWFGSGSLLLLLPVSAVIVSLVLPVRTLLVVTKEVRAELELSVLSGRHAALFVDAVNSARQHPR